MGSFFECQNTSWNWHNMSRNLPWFPLNLYLMKLFVKTIEIIIFFTKLFNEFMDNSINSCMFYDQLLKKFAIKLIILNYFTKRSIDYIEERAPVSRKLNVNWPRTSWVTRTFNKRQQPWSRRVRARHFNKPHSLVEVVLSRVTAVQDDSRDNTQNTKHKITII